MTKTSNKTKEQIDNLDLKIQQMKAKKQQLESRLKEKERKERTHRLIQVGAIFENYFDFEGKDEAEQYALYLQEKARSEKEKIKSIDVEESKKSKQVVYKIGEERLIMDSPKNDLYKVNSNQ